MLARRNRARLRNITFLCERKRKRERDWSHLPLRQFGKKEEKQSWDGVARKGMRQKENDFARIKAEERV